MDGVNHKPEDDADAVRALEALRAQVAALRRAVEERDAPDDSQTLGAMGKVLTAIGSRLDKMEAHPALRLTPEQHTQQIAAGIRAARGEVLQSVAAAGTQLDEATRALQAMIGAAQSRRAQRRQVWIAAVVGVVLGFVAWWPLTRVLPRGGGAWLATTVIGGGRWVAGQALMREADPVTWERMTRLYNACPAETVIDLCQAAMAERASPAAPPPIPPEGAKSGLPGAVPAKPVSHGNR